MAVKACKGCGVMFDGPSRRRYCSERCRVRADYERGLNRECVCKRCNRTFRPKMNDRTTFCSRECSYAHRAHMRVELEALARIRANWRRAIRRMRRANKMPPKPCERCGRMFTGATPYTHAEQRFCSLKCSQNHSKGYACVDCGTLCVGNPRALRCAECRKRQARALHRKAKMIRKRRARRDGAEAVRADVVFVRDGYRCGICGRKTLKGKAVPHPRAPTLDHIIPLARGGKHRYDNVQCACFRCNTVAKDNAAGKQLLLIG